MTFFNELNNDFLISYRRLIFFKEMSRHLIILNHDIYLRNIYPGVFYIRFQICYFLTFLTAYAFGYRHTFSHYIQAKYQVQVNIVELPVLLILKYKSFLGVVFTSRSLVLHLLDQEAVLLISGLMNNLCTRFGNLNTHSPLQYSAR